MFPRPRPFIARELEFKIPDRFPENFRQMKARANDLPVLG